MVGVRTSSFPLERSMTWQLTARFGKEDQEHRKTKTERCHLKDRVSDREYIRLGQLGITCRIEKKTSFRAHRILKVR